MITLKIKIIRDNTVYTLIQSRDFYCKLKVTFKVFYRVEYILLQLIIYPLVFKTYHQGPGFYAAKSQKFRNIVRKMKLLDYGNLKMCINKKVEQI